MIFNDIPGLSELKQRLINSVKSAKVAHSQLFTGKPGSLNLPIAIAYATYIHCLNRGDSDACGTCSACSKNLKYIHPDTHFVFPSSNVKGEKDPNRFKAEITKMWRQFLLENPFGNLSDWIHVFGGEEKGNQISRETSRDIMSSLSLKPFESQYKVMIIWLPELMHKSASNGILKILEEPPENTFFFLVTNSDQHILPTIRSRTQYIQVNMLSDNEMLDFLAKDKGVDADKANHIVKVAEGNVSQALNMLDNTVLDENTQIINWLRACYSKDYKQLLVMMDEFNEANKIYQQTFLFNTLNILRDSLLHISGANELVKINPEDIKFLSDFSKVLTLNKIEKADKLITDASNFLEQNGNAKMIFFELSLLLSGTLLGI